MLLAEYGGETSRMSFNKVLVDRIKLLTRALEAFAPECEDEPDTPVRIRVKFSDFPCFEITQDLAPVPKEKKDSDPLTTPTVFSSGKSCMFPMDPEQLIQDLVKYPMAVTVFKKNEGSPIPEIIGQTKVPLGDYMSKIIKRASEWSLEEPLSEMIQDTFPLRNAQDQDVGTITMLIRLTCFGKTIITKFQIADNKKSFLFKNAKTQDYEFKCKKCMPGQPILRPRPIFQDEEEEDENALEGEGYGVDEPQLLPCFDKEQMTEDYQDPCVQQEQVLQNPTQQVNKEPNKPETYQPPPTPGFQKHEGPGFTASMEVAYPDEYQDNYGQSKATTGPTESQSAPAVRKGRGGKSKTRGKSLDTKKLDATTGVKLDKKKRKKRTKFHVPQGIAYPGIILGHKYCVNQGPPVPARNGWAWKTTVPAGMKWEDMRGWRPGAYTKQAWATLKAMEELRKMGKRKKVKRKPVLPDTRKTTVHIHRIKGIYHVTVNPVKGPEDKEDPEPIVYTLERPEDGSDASEIELDLTVPDPPYPPPPALKHQAQQFCEEDLPLILPKPVFIKKKKKKDKKPLVAAVSSKKKKPGSAKSGSVKSDGSKKLDKKQEGKGKDKTKRKDSLASKKGKDSKGGKGAGKGTGKGGSKETPKKGAKTASGKQGSPSGKGGKGAPAGGSKGGAAGKKGGLSKKELSGKDAQAAKKGKPTPETPSKTKKKGKGKKKGDDDDDVYPWDDWIMKLKCKNQQSPED